MPSIINFIQEVANSNPNNQSIHIRATSPWLNALAAQFPIVNNVILALHSNNNGERTILRSDVKYSNTAEEKIVRALIWAYPSGMHNHYESDILNRIPDISTSLMAIQNASLSLNDLRQCFTVFINTYGGIGDRTASILFYFFDVKCSIIPCLAVTEYVIRAFDDIDEFHGLNAHSSYITIISRISEVANHYKISAEQVEFFLFKYGKHLTQLDSAAKKALKKVQKQTIKKNKS